MRNEESKRIQQAADKEYEKMQLEKLGVKDDKFEEVFAIDNDHWFYQYLSRNGEYFMNVDGETMLGPFIDHVECIKNLVNIIIQKEVEHSKKYHEIHKLVDKW